VILEEALRQLYRDRVPEVFLEVDENNPAARALYAKLGFAEVGRRKGYYRDGEGGESAALVLRLQLR
jgi:ribosomal-protein-alanine N-acetyltransferase